MLNRFFNSIGDVDIAKQMMARESTVRVQKYEYIGKGIFGLSAGVSTLTPDVSPAWGVDDFESTVARNLLVVDDNGKVADVKITENSPSVITFDEADLKLLEDGTTAATLTDTSEYSFYVLTPSADASGEYGPYLGDTEGLELAVNDEVMVHKYSQPAKKRRVDLKERAITIQGGTVNIVNDDVFEMMFGASEYGATATKKLRGVGSNNSFDRFYRFTFESQDVTGKVEKLVAHMVQVSLNGNYFSKAASGHLMIPFKGDVLADNFYPEDANMLMRIGDL